MKKILISLAIFSFIIFSQIKIDSYATETDKKAPGYISLTGTDSKEVDSNIATIIFAIENSANEVKKATVQNNEISNKIVTALKAIATEGTDTIKTANFAVRPIYTSTKDGKREIKNYVAVNSVAIKTKDVNKIQKFIDTAISNGANRVENLSFTYEQDQSTCQDLYKGVIKNLNTQAEALATSSGMTLDGIKQLNASCSTDSSISARYYYSNAKTSAADGEYAEGSSTPIEAGKVKVRVYINADYYVK